MATAAETISIEPIDALDPSVPARFADGSVHPLMTRLRAEAPVHYCRESKYGPFWSITRHKDISEIEALPLIYSSESARGGVSIVEPPEGREGQAMEMFIAMDPPRHAEKRRVVAPAFTPSEMVRLSENIRARTATRLDTLPRGEVFDWVKLVSTDLTTDMLAILFDFPWDERHKLPIWSDMITSLDMIDNHPQERLNMMFEMAARFYQLWQERLNAEPAPDLLSMMIHSSALGQMDQLEFIGNMALLIVGGNDTTRNSMSGLIDAINRWPEEWEKILSNPQIIPTAASETIRWVSPVSHMRRTVTQDTVFRGHQFREGDKIVMWYISANRDEQVFEDGARFIADRENARRHLSFGYGVHRCVGARLAELQIQTLITEMAARQMKVELAGDVIRDPHPFVGIIKSVPVRITQG
jgi:cytochrome P450